MGIRTPKLASLNLNDFCRFFRTKMRDPIIAKALDSISDVHIKNKANHYFDSEIAKRLYAEIEKAEFNTGLSGVQKKGMIDAGLWSYLNEIGLTVLFPILAAKLQELLLGMYKEYYLAKFTRYGLEEYVEAITKMDIDGDGDIAGIPTTPPSEEETAPVNDSGALSFDSV